MKLKELLKGVAVLSSTADGEAEIGEVRYDSRAVGKGDLFVAIRGYATDGHKYIEKALEQGAAAVVCEEAPEGAPCCCSALRGRPKAAYSAAYPRSCPAALPC